MAAEKAPAFQFYPKEFLIDGNVAGMSLQERGAYITLICLCWQERTLPNETARLANMVGLPHRAFLKLWPALSPCFVEQDGRLIHPRLEKEREKQAAYRQRQSEAGRARAQGPRLAATGQFNGNRTSTADQPADQPDASHGSTTTQPAAQPEAKSPISDLRSPYVVSTKLHSDRRLDDSPEAAALELRAGQLLERYAELFTVHRKGARYHNRMHLDFPKACEIVQTWADDARLEKLAVLVLTTDDDWISRTDRGFGIFAARASWADDRLAVWEAEHKH